MKPANSGPNNAPTVDADVCNAKARPRKSASTSDVIIAAPTGRNAATNKLPTKNTGEGYHMFGMNPDAKYIAPVPKKATFISLRSDDLSITCTQLIALWTNALPSVPYPR